MSPTDQEKRRLAGEAVWPVDVAAEYFGIDPIALVDFIAQPGALNVNRFDLERKLAREGLTSLDWLALSFGVPNDALEQAMRKPPQDLRLAPFPLDAYGEKGRFFFSRRQAEAWVKDLLPKHKVWSSLNTRARDLAAILNSSVRVCAVSQRFGESPPDVATCRCIVTWDDVSRVHQEYLENGKHLSLEPDHVGWHAIFDKKVSVDELWRSDLTNFQSYIQQHGKTWKAA